MAELDEVTEGYMDGFASDLDELPDGNNRSESYKHGWKNGRDDRLVRPRASARRLREEAEEIRRRESEWL